MNLDPIVVSKLLNLAVHWPSKVWPVGMIARKICSTIERNDFKIHYTTGHFIPKQYLSLVFMTIETLKSPNPRNRNSFSVKFLSASSMASLCLPFRKLLTRDVTSYWRADCTSDFLGDTSPLPTPPVCKQLSVSFVQVHLIRWATFVSGLIVLQSIGTRNLRAGGGVALSWILLHLDLISNLRSYLIYFKQVTRI